MTEKAQKIVTQNHPVFRLFFGYEGIGLESASRPLHGGKTFRLHAFGTRRAAFFVLEFARGRAVLHHAAAFVVRNHTFHSRRAGIKDIRLHHSFECFRGVIHRSETPIFQHKAILPGDP